MSASIPDGFLDLFEEKNAFADLGTVMPDGSPQVTPVWCNLDGGDVMINSAKGRIKDKNMRRNPKVSLSLRDPENPYRYLGIRGEVVEITEDGADDHIDRLAQKYMDEEEYPFREPGEIRVTYRIEPQKVHTKE